MSTIVTRAGKGSALTHAEVDANFINLNTDKLEAAQSVTLTNKTISGSNNTLSNIGNSSLTNSSVTLGSTSVTLGSTVTSVSGLSLSGGAINNATIGASTATTGAFTVLSASSDSSFTSTGALQISKGTTGEQPGSPATGMIRYNTTTSQFEGYSGSSPAWKSIGGSALSNDTSTASTLYPVFAGATTGTAENLYTSNAKLLYKPSTGELSASIPRASNGIFVNTATVSTSYTVATGDNAMSAGVITIANGVTVTVSDGSRWTVV